MMAFLEVDDDDDDDDDDNNVAKPESWTSLIPKTVIGRDPELVPSTSHPHDQSP
jgi:hypothetical protein